MSEIKRGSASDVESDGSHGRDPTAEDALRFGILAIGAVVAIGAIIGAPNHATPDDALRKRVEDAALRELGKEQSNAGRFKDQFLGEGNSLDIPTTEGGKGLLLNVITQRNTIMHIGQGCLAGSPWDVVERTSTSNSGAYRVGFNGKTFYPIYDPFGSTSTSTIPARAEVHDTSPTSFTVDSLESSAGVTSLSFTVTTSGQVAPATTQTAEILADPKLHCATAGVPVLEYHDPGFGPHIPEKMQQLYTFVGEAYTPQVD